MQHGIYVTEFERELFRRGFAISHHSRGQLVNQVDFSKLRLLRRPASESGTLCPVARAHERARAADGHSC
jgi:hypothetical protein